MLVSESRLNIIGNYSKLVLFSTKLKSHILLHFHSTSYDMWQKLEHRAHNMRLMIVVDSLSQASYNKFDKSKITFPAPFLDYMKLLNYFNTTVWYSQEREEQGWLWCRIQICLENFFRTTVYSEYKKLNQVISQVKRIRLYKLKKKIFKLFNTKTMSDRTMTLYTLRQEAFGKSYI